MQAVIHLKILTDIYVLKTKTPFYRRNPFRPSIKNLTRLSM